MLLFLENGKPAKASLLMLFMACQEGILGLAFMDSKSWSMPCSHAVEQILPSLVLTSPDMRTLCRSLVSWTATMSTTRCSTMVRGLGIDCC